MLGVDWTQLTMLLHDAWTRPIRERVELTALFHHSQIAGPLNPDSSTQMTYCVSPTIPHTPTSLT